MALFARVVLNAAFYSERGTIVCFPGACIVLGAVAQLPGIVLVIVSFFSHEIAQELAVAGMLCIVFGVIALIYGGQNATWLDRMRHRNGGSHSEQDVDACEDVVLLCPFMGFTVVFSCVYSQMQSSFVLQGCQMDLRTGHLMLSSAQLVSIAL